MKLVNLIPLKEIDFRNQDQFDDYVKQHSLRPDTKVTINGKVTTAGQAAQQSKDKAVKGTSVFGKDKGGDVFGGDTSKAKQADTPSKPEPEKSTNWSFGALSGNAAWVAANAGLNHKYLGNWADDNLIDLNKVADAVSNKKLKFTDIATAVSGNPGNKYAKAIASKYPLEPKDFEKYPKKAQPEEGSIESLTSYKKLANFYKTNKDKLDKNYVDDIKGQIGALKYLESDYKRGDADWEEVLVAYEELQDLIKKAMSDSGSTKLSSMIPKSASGAKDKSITDIKTDKQVDVSNIAKTLSANLRLTMSPSGEDKDAVELKKRLENGDSGVYTRTSPHGGNIVFKDGSRWEVFRPHDAKKTKSTTIYASKR